MNQIGSIEWCCGNIFDSLGTITIPVNTVGTLGAGLALQAKKLFPQLNYEYRKMCFSSALDIGKPQFSHGNEILLFPTKKHWRNDSKMEYIDSGLAYLRAAFQDSKIKCKNDILALPKLGCGLGKLEWDVVGKLIIIYLGDAPITIEVYGEEPEHNYGR